MQCPICSVELVSSTVRGLSVDTCSQCQGLFLDRGELNAIAEPTAGDLEFSTLHDESFRHDDAHGPVACPRCDGSTMKKVEFNIYTGIILDYCPRCEGFWLDGKEIDRINDEVKRLNSEADADADDPPMLWFARFIWTLPK